MEQEGPGKERQMEQVVLGRKPGLHRTKQGQQLPKKRPVAMIRMAGLIGYLGR